MKKCKYCKTEIEKGTKICPNCKKKQSNPVGIIVGAIVVIGVIGAVGGNQNKVEKVGEVSSSNVNTSSVQTQASVSNKFIVGDIVETSDVRVSYLSSGEYKSDNQFLQPKEGMKYYRFEFEMENISKSDITISSMLLFNCYADGYAVDQTFIGDDTLDSTISVGRKAKGSVYYEVPKDAKEIELEYKTKFYSNNTIIFIGK